ncbi:hypothetical protein [Spirosoma validum]|uniref:Uncharacterized protein n=1 Tax=Spirosoma validum TaxID=2771355 RepID=A0A927B885_9BACT|nr:hypothetical protein [Spirosoma validum]MBD2757169.1 hypothetical protein [Spirosoma validum]
MKTNNQTTDSKESARACVIENAVEALKQNNGVVIVHQTYKSVNEPVVIPSNFFIEATSDTAYLSEVREALRSWFCCYLPVHEVAHGPGIEQATKLYQDLDEFISNLIVATADQ